MCGRFADDDYSPEAEAWRASIRALKDAQREAYGPLRKGHRPSFDVRPTQVVPILTSSGAELARWGWQRDFASGGRQGGGSGQQDSTPTSCRASAWGEFVQGAAMTEAEKRIAHLEYLRGVDQQNLNMLFDYVAKMRARMIALDPGAAAALGPMPAPSQAAGRGS